MVYSCPGGYDEFSCHQDKLQPAEGTNLCRDLCDELETHAHCIKMVSPNGSTNFNEPFKNIICNFEMSEKNKHYNTTISFKFHLRAGQKNLGKLYNQRKWFFYLGFKRLLNQKYSLCNQFYQYIRFTRVRSTQKILYT